MYADMDGDPSINGNEKTSNLSVKSMMNDALFSNLQIGTNINQKLN